MSAAALSNGPVELDGGWWLQRMKDGSVRLEKRTAIMARNGLGEYPTDTFAILDVIDIDWVTWVQEVEPALRFTAPYAAEPTLTAAGIEGA